MLSEDKEGWTVLENWFHSQAQISGSSSPMSESLLRMSAGVIVELTHDVIRLRGTDGHEFVLELERPRFSNVVSAAAPEKAGQSREMLTIETEWDDWTLVGPEADSGSALTERSLIPPKPESP